MADKTIGELPAASEVYDDSLLVMEQQGEARSVQGALIKKYAREATAAYVEEARKSAEEGKGYRDAAAESARDAADVALHPPILKEENDHWWIWDTDLNDYKDSGIDAGVSLEVVEEIITGETGTPASVRNLGTKTDPRLQFTIPEGKKGDKGDAATIEVGEVTTGEPGTSASVKNSGTSGAAKLDFVIPQGPTGRGFTILGKYDSYEALDFSVPEPSVGDAYQVGTEKPYDVYIYDAEEGWVNSGPINVDLPAYLIVGEDSELGTVLPVDADTLDGHPADYFASKSSMDTELGKKQDVLPYYSNRNILDNPDFRNPVNQRGQTKYTGFGYCLDRWILSPGSDPSSAVTVGDGFVTLSGAGTFVQGVEEMNLWGKTVTGSILTDKGLFTSTFTLSPGVYFKNNEVSLYCVQRSDGRLGVYIACIDGVPSANLIAVKLELGSQQTLAHKEGDAWVLNEIPDYATELAKCQRYQRVYVPNTGATNSTIAVGVTTGRSDNICFIPIPGGMRTFPTLIATGNFRYNLPGIIVYNVSSLQISPGNCSKEFIAILVTLSDSDGNNRGAFSTLSFSFADNSKLILDANL